MANFLKPVTATDGYEPRKPYGLNFVRIPLNGTRDVALFGGDAGGKPLWVQPNDMNSPGCPVTCAEVQAQGGNRLFRLKAKAMGSTMLEARLGGQGGPVWDFVQVVVGAATVQRGGPKLGHDGAIPARYLVTLSHAIDRAWALNTKPGFVYTFNDVVNKLTFGKVPISPTLYSDTLNRMIVNLLDTSRDQRVARGLAKEAVDIAQHALSGRAPAVSFQYEPNIWIRSSAFDAGTEQVTSCVFHEAAHVAGARGEQTAEVALDVLHQAAGIPR